MVERVAGLVEGHILRQHHRQVRIRHRHHIAFRAMDHRDRAAPVALARNAPVPQAKIHLALADRRITADFGFQPLRHLVLGLLDGHTVEEARIDHAAVAVIGGVGDHKALGVLAFRTHDGGVAECVFVDEVEIALVVRRAAEDGAGAVFHQYEVRDIDRQLPVGIERMYRADTGVEALLLRGVDNLLRGADAFYFGDELREFRILRSRGLRQRMVGCNRHEFGAEQRVMSCGEYPQLVLAIRRSCRIERETHQHAFGAADPVALHDPHPIGPAVERIERVQQFLRVLRDLEDPLVHLALLDDGAGTPAAAVDHLLVGEHGHVDRVPVELALFAFGKPCAQEVQKHLLLMLVVSGIAGREFA